MSKRDDERGPVDLVILALSLAALCGVLLFAIVTGDSEGPEPIPLPTAPTVAP